MTLEDINDPKWVAYDKGAKRKKKDDSHPTEGNALPEKNPSLDELKEIAQYSNSLDELIVGLGWDATKTTLYERKFGADLLFKIAFVELRTDGDWYIITPDVLQRNPAYDSKNPGSEARFISKKMKEGDSQFITQSRTEAEEYLWRLIITYDKMNNDNGGNKS